MTSPRLAAAAASQRTEAEVRALREKPFPTKLHLAESDGEYTIFDAESDNGDVVAMVDPDRIFDGLGYNVEAFASLIVAAPALNEFARTIANMFIDGEDDGSGENQAFEQAGDDAIEVLSALINSAREMLKIPPRDKPKCRTGCTDTGRGICAHCDHPTR